MIQAVPTSTNLGTALGATATGTTGGVSAAQQNKLKSAAQAFEAVFLRQMISSMRDASLGDGMFDNEGTEQFQSMADSQTADSMAHKGVLGIADMLMKQLGPIAGAQSGSATSPTIAAAATKASDDIIARGPES